MKNAIHRSRAAAWTVLAMFLVAMVPMSAAAQSVFLNEIRIDQVSTDNDEYFELVGDPGTSLDGLTYLVIGDGTGGSGVIEAVADLTGSAIPASGFFVAAEATFTLATADLVANLNFENSDNVTHLLVRDFTGANADDLDTDDDGVLDVTPWSAVEDCVALIETPGSGEQTYCTATVGPDGTFVPGHPIFCPDGWAVGAFDIAVGDDTPGAANVCPEPILVINEIDYDQPSTDAAEFIEIANAGTIDVDLDAYELQLVNGSTGTAYVTIDLPAVVLSAGAYFVVCGDAANVDNCDLDVSPNTNLIQNGAPDAVALMLAGAIVDTVSYEGDVAGFVEGSGAGLADSSSADDVGISRFPDGADTDMNNVDFVVSCITPGAANTDVATDCGVVPEAVLVINEIDYDQPSTDTAEFIEIKNVGADPVNLDPYALQLVNGSNTSPYNTIDLPAVSLAPGGYFVVCGDAAAVGGCDLDVSPDSNLVQNGAPDAVALVLGATIVDTVSYEGDVAGFVEGSGAGLADSSSTANVGISRFADGVDTDMNNVDFSLRCITPGAANSADTSNCPDAGPSVLVINEVDYDQPGADTAEFVEIRNNGTGPADLSTISVSLINGNGGTAYQTVGLPATSLAAGDYFVICADALTVAACDLEAFSSIQNGAPDAVALLDAGAVIDVVSYEGDVAGFVEGSGAGLEDSGASGEDFKGISRLPDGTDTDMNNVDFGFVCITPGSANTTSSVGCTPTGPVFEIWEIQGSGAQSPLAGQAVTTLANVVTALGTDGFFMQTPVARTDGDIATSDGIFVFQDTPPTVVIGDLVDVSGIAVEFFDFTEIGGSPTVTVVGNDPAQIPPAVVFDATVPSPDPTTPSCGAFEFECYEGMRIDIAGTVSESNQSFGSDPFAEVYISAGPNRAFREPGIVFPGMAGLPVWDGNPEVFELDPDKLGLPNEVIPAGSTFQASGVLGFEFGGYELWPNSLTVTPAPLPVPVRAAGPDELTIGSLNIFRLFDDVDDPPSTNSVGDSRDDAVVSAAEYLRRRLKLAVHIVDVLGSPDILAVQEAEKVEVLDALAGDIAAYDPTVSYTAYLVEGNDVGTIDVGFLVRDRVQVTAVTQLGATELFTFDNPPSALHDRPPLLLEGLCDGNFPIAVMVVHMRSLGGIDSPTSGPRVRAKRFAQAESVALMVQGLQTTNPAINLAVVGDFNAFEFTDGYVDLVGIIQGDSDPSQSLISGADLVDPDLSNQALAVDASDRYSFIFNGSSQVLDHILTSSSLDPLVTGVAYGRGNADAAEELIEDDIDPANIPLRSSDHDGMVIYVRKDGDGDGVLDGDDLCADTTIPEGVPTVRLGLFRYALTDGDTIFDTRTPPWFPWTLPTFTTESTGGCSCEQIIDILGLGLGQTKFGCGFFVMKLWSHYVSTRGPEEMSLPSAAEIDAALAKDRELPTR